MDAKQLAEIRSRLDPLELPAMHVPFHALGRKQDIADLLAYVDALKADMAKIHGIASQLMSLSQLAAATAGTDIYQITMQHVSEPENGA